MERNQNLRIRNSGLPNYTHKAGGSGERRDKRSVTESFVSLSLAGRELGHPLAIPFPPYLKVLTQVLGGPPNYFLL